MSENNTEQVTTLIMLRHAEPEKVVVVTDQDGNILLQYHDEETGLTRKGRIQSKALPIELKKRGIVVDGLFSSTLKRAVLTTEDLRASNLVRYYEQTRILNDIWGFRKFSQRMELVRRNDVLFNGKPIEKYYRSLSLEEKKRFILPPGEAKLYLSRDDPYFSAEGSEEKKRFILPPREAKLYLSRDDPYFSAEGSVVVLQDLLTGAIRMIVSNDVHKNILEYLETFFSFTNRLHFFTTKQLDAYSGKTIGFIGHLSLLAEIDRLVFKRERTLTREEIEGQNLLHEISNAEGYILQVQRDNNGEFSVVEHTPFTISEDSMREAERSFREDLEGRTSIPEQGIHIRRGVER